MATSVWLFSNIWETKAFLDEVAAVAEYLIEDGLSIPTIASEDWD